MRRTASLPIVLETRQPDAAGTDLSLHPRVHSRWTGQCRPAPAFDAPLAADLGVSRTTALLALEQLRAEGYVVARPGSGMFIAPQSARQRRHRRCHCDKPRRASAVFAARLLAVAHAGARPAAASRTAAHSAWAHRRSICFRSAAGRSSRANACVAETVSQLRLLAARRLASLARGHCRAGAVARHALRRRPGAGGDGRAARPGPSSRTCCSIRATRPGWKTRDIPVRVVRWSRGGRHRDPDARGRAKA